MTGPEAVEKALTKLEAGQDVKIWDHRREVAVAGGRPGAAVWIKSFGMAGEAWIL